MNGRLVRVATDERRGTFTLQGVCECGYKSDRLEVLDQGSDRRNAPPTVRVARALLRHQHAEHG